MTEHHEIVVVRNQTGSFIPALATLDDHRQAAEIIEWLHFPLPLETANSFAVFEGARRGLKVTLANPTA